MPDSTDDVMAGLDSVPARRSKVADGIDAAGGFITRVGKMTDRQALTALVIVLTVFVCILLAILIWRGPQPPDTTSLALILRVQESEGEKNRAATGAEQAANRATASAEGKDNRLAIAELARVTTESNRKLAVEIAKLEASNQRLEQALNDLRKKIGSEELSGPLAPMPRLKAPPGG